MPFFRIGGPGRKEGDGRKFSTGEVKAEPEMGDRNGDLGKRKGRKIGKEKQCNHWLRVRQSHQRGETRKGDAKFNCVGGAAKETRDRTLGKAKGESDVKQTFGGNQGNRIGWVEQQVLLKGRRDSCVWERKAVS